MAMLIETLAETQLPAGALPFFPGAAHPLHHGRACYGQSLTGVALVVEFMKLAGVEVIFGIPGGTSLPLNDALTSAHHDRAFRYILTGHEQGAAFEAEGYAAASGRPGFCTATSGPGATNLITGLADAFRDSRPVVALTGNTATTAEVEAFQALDIVGITNGRATKASFRPERASDLQAMLVLAYHTAVTGRPGSVLIDLPKDVQVASTPMRPWEDLIARYDWSPPHADDETIAIMARMLAASSRPVIYAGHGVSLSGAAAELRELSLRYDLPVATTVHGLGLLPVADGRNLGMLGMHGMMVANLAPYLADLVIALGARFDDRVVGARPECFAPNAQVIHVDVDARQLNRVRRVDLAIHGDVKDTLRRLLDHLTAPPTSTPPVDRAPWLAQLAAIRRALPTVTYDDQHREQLSHEFVYAAMATALADRGGDSLATFDVGTHQMKGAQWFPVDRPRSFITSGGMGSMGSSVPMAVGAHFARPAATVFAVAGDGGFVMSSHELDTIGAYQIPIKMVVFDDSALGMVTNWHGLFFGGRDLTSDRRRGRTTTVVDVAAVADTLRARLAGDPDADTVAAALCEATSTLAQSEWPLFAGTAAAYGIPAERIHTKDQFLAALRRALAAPGPYLLHVILPSKSQVYPLMEPGTTPQDMVWRETSPGSGVRVHAREHFDYQARCLYPAETG